MADAMLKCLEDRGLSDAFGRAARTRVEARFGEGRMLQDLVALLDRLVARHLDLTFRPGVGWVAS
jgi:glycosyltransferase involved in cell wall biosynthesis